MNEFPPPRGAELPKAVEPGDVLTRAEAVTATTAVEVEQGKRGPGANPALRFAVWALARYPSLTRREIAAQLDMRPRQVDALLVRLREDGPGAQLTGWDTSWTPAAE